MRKALGIGGFPLELTLNRRGKKEVPAVPFNENPVSHLNEEIKIFVTPIPILKCKIQRNIHKRKN